MKNFASRFLFHCYILSCVNTTSYSSTLDSLPLYIPQSLSLSLFMYQLKTLFFCLHFIYFNSRKRMNTLSKQSTVEDTSSSSSFIFISSFNIIFFYIYESAEKIVNHGVKIPRQLFELP